MKNKLLKEKFIEMHKKQLEFFKDRLSANVRMMNLQINIIKEEVIKSNAKHEKPPSDPIPEKSTKDLQVRMLKSLLRQNKLDGDLSKNQSESLELAKQYHQILTDPEKLVDDYNKVNKYEKDVKIGLRKGKK
jgi:hypothetical protein